MGELAIEDPARKHRAHLKDLGLKFDLDQLARAVEINPRHLYHKALRVSFRDGKILFFAADVHCINARDFYGGVDLNAVEAEIVLL